MLLSRHHRGSQLHPHTGQAAAAAAVLMRQSWPSHPQYSHIQQQQLQKLSLQCNCCQQPQCGQAACVIICGHWCLEHSSSRSRFSSSSVQQQLLQVATRIPPVLARLQGATPNQAAAKPPNSASRYQQQQRNAAKVLLARLVKGAGNLRSSNSSSNSSQDGSCYMQHRGSSSSQHVPSFQHPCCYISTKSSAAVMSLLAGSKCSDTDHLTSPLTCVYADLQLLYVHCMPADSHEAN